MGSCCCSSAYVSLSSSERVERERVRKGYVPILVGKEMGDMEKVWIPIKLLSHPRIVALLRRSAHEFGFQQQGLLKIKHDSANNSSLGLTDAEKNSCSTPRKKDQLPPNDNVWIFTVL
ncbi:hypothetical protein Pyn_05168 [Prunus yedoensis var. nudiflora]|uniref:Uncharacterized protein n=1 Tax=Prunus yedoensis var. nudiflora TaxID=2094558 RepID=A0A314YNZ6_PRUYE|nr:hypothetical protein Pyn_05168 [Prunus yedoensis var. nudiflora]